MTKRYLLKVLGGGSWSHFSSCQGEVEQPRLQVWYSSQFLVFLTIYFYDRLKFERGKIIVGDFLQHQKNGVNPHDKEVVNWSQ
jgi:hypothetical protein